jgi:hypothetical protein
MNIWILENTSGLTLFYKSFMNLKVDEHLVSGLLSALNQFTISEFNDPIESIDMGGFRWIYILDKDNNLLFVASDSKNINAEILRARLEFTRHSFIDKFNINDAFWEGKWHGDMGIFDAFDEIIEQYYYQWTQAEDVMSVAEFFDILGIFQKILNMIRMVLEEHTVGVEKDFIYKKIDDFFETFINQEEVKDNQELSKISYSKSSGFNIINIDPNNCDIVIVKQQIFILISDIVQIIKERIGHELSLVYFDRVKLYTYLFNNIEFLKELNLDNFLFQLFLS